jgi:hypothetical protein
MQTMRQPVTLGSSVPLWPVFSTLHAMSAQATRAGCDAYLSMRLTHDTTSWLDGFEGLSRLMTPELMYDLMSRDKGVHPVGMGVKCGVRTRTANC